MIWRVSSSGRSCGRPRQRRSVEDSALAMFLHDACHSIDSSDIGFILEIVKFPNSERRTAMTVHSTSFPADQKVGAAAAEALLPASAATPQLLVAKKLNLRKLLFTGVAIA